MKTLRCVCDDRIHTLAHKLAENHGTSVSEYLRQIIEMEAALDLDITDEEYNDEN